MDLSDANKPRGQAPRSSAWWPWKAGLCLELRMLLAAAGELELQIDGVTVAQTPAPETTVKSTDGLKRFGAAMVIDTATVRVTHFPDEVVLSREPIGYP